MCARKLKLTSHVDAVIRKDYTLGRDSNGVREEIMEGKRGHNLT